MNFKKILGSLLIILFISYTAFGQQLKMKRNRNIVRVMQGKKILYQVALRGKPNEKKRKYDEAFMAGSCLIVRRDVQEDELFPRVSQVEIYQSNGKKRIYREPEVEIRRLGGYRVFTSPDFSWAVIPDEEEGGLMGYFYISPGCRLRGVEFKESPNFDWGESLEGIFINASTLKIPSVSDELPEGQKRKVDIFITKNGQYQIKDEAKQ